MPDLSKLGDITPVDGGAKPAPLPLAVRKSAVCDSCKEPLKRFCTGDGATGALTYNAHRCAKCGTWLKQFTTFDRTTLQLVADPRPVKTVPVIGEAMSIALEE